MQADEMSAIQYIKLANGRARSSKKGEGHHVDFGALIKKALGFVFENHGTIFTKLNQRSKNRIS